MAFLECTDTTGLEIFLMLLIGFVQLVVSASLTFGFHMVFKSLFKAEQHPKTLLKLQETNITLTLTKVTSKKQSKKSSKLI